MSAYIHSQYLLQRITSDFFQDMKQDQPLTWKAIPSQNRLHDSDEETFSDEDEQEEHLDKSNRAQSIDGTYYCHPDSVSLTYEFDLCDDKAYTVILCPYKINYEGRYPFVQYCLVPGENDSWIFPQFPFRCASNITHEDEEHSAKHVYFENECMKSLLRYVEPNTDNNEHDEQAFGTTYKGYVQDGTTIYVVMNMEHFRMREKQLHTLAIMDEMVNIHACKTKVIESSVYQFFYKEPALLHIFNEERQPLPTPIVGYQCIENEKGEYVNEEEFEEDMVSLLDKRMNHPLVGDTFLFSRNLLQPDEKFQRYALFIDDAEYLMENVHSLIPEKEKETGFSLGKVIPSIVEFTQKKKEEESEEVDSEEEEQKEDEEEDALKHDIDDTSLYFQQLVGDKQQAFWSLPSSSFFVEL